MSNDQEIARLSRELAQAVLNAPSERHLENYYITNSKDERTSDEMVVLVMKIPARKVGLVRAFSERATLSFVVKATAKGPGEPCPLCGGSGISPGA